jgi:hypothetical protein
MLVAWQMNSRGASMHEFDVFRSSLLQIWDKTEPLRGKTPDALNESDWADLKEVFKTIKCMESGVSLVGNSKVMAHLLPNLIPPMDGRFTLGFVCGEVGASSLGLDAEWDLLVKLLKEFFHPIALNPEFAAKAKLWFQQNGGKWDTSPLKIADNLVMELSKIKIRSSGDEHAMGDRDCEVCKQIVKKLKIPKFPKRHYKLIPTSDCPGFVHIEEAVDGTPTPQRWCDGCRTFI